MAPLTPPQKALIVKLHCQGKTISDIWRHFRHDFKEHENIRKSRKPSRTSTSTSFMIVSRICRRLWMLLLKRKAMKRSTDLRIWNVKIGLFFCGGNFVILVSFPRKPRFYGKNSLKSPGEIQSWSSFSFVEKINFHVILEQICVSSFFLSTTVECVDRQPKPTGVHKA